MVIKKEEGDREIRLIASRDRLKESTQELVRSFKEIYDDNAKFDKLVYNLIRKSGMDSFYKSRVEEISNLYKFKDSLFKDENLDDFFDFLFKNYKLIYTKLQEPVSEIIKNISYKEVEVEKIVSQTLEELALDGRILNLASLLTGGIPIFMLPDENIQEIKENISYKVLKDIKKIAMSIDPNQWNRVWSVIGESL